MLIEQAQAPQRPRTKALAKLPREPFGQALDDLLVVPRALRAGLLGDDDFAAERIDRISSRAELPAPRWHHPRDSTPAH